MEVSLSTKGQVVIPKDIRDKLHWEPGVRLDIQSSDGGVIIRARSAVEKRPADEVVGILAHLAKGKKQPTDAEIKAALGGHIARKYEESQQ